MQIQFDEHVPHVHPTSWIADTASVIGQVTLAERVGVFYGAVLRGDTGAITVGAGTNLQDCCVVHADPGLDVTIGESVTVGHSAVLHGCTIGSAVLVGMGAVVLNGASVGDGSLIAAKALVPEGALIPAHSLVVGVPATVRRTLTAEERAAAVANARRYEALAARHARAVSRTGRSASA